MEIAQQGFKKTKIGWIPEEWEVKHFEKAAKIIMGQSPDGKSYNQVGNGVPLINGPTEFTKRYPIKKQWTNSPTKLCQDKDILLCVRGSSTGRINISNNVYCIGRGIAAIRTNAKHSHTFIEYQLKNAVFRILRLTAGSTFPNIDSKSLKGILVALPPLPEQKKIASILSTWDKAIEVLSDLIAAKEEAQKGIMQRLLRGKVHWKAYRYGQVLQAVKRPFKFDDEALYDLISVRRRSGGLFHRSSLYGKEILTKNLRTAKMGDFLISKMQIVHGASGLTTKAFDGMKISGSYIAIVSKDPQLLDIEFLNWLSKMPLFSHHAYISSHGVHIEKMTFHFKTFLKKTVHLPSLEKQKASVQILNTSATEIGLLQDKLGALEAQKKGLMQRLLTGRVRVAV